MDTGQLLQQLFQVLQANQPANGATRAFGRVQSGLNVGKQLGLDLTNQPFLTALSQGVPRTIKATFPSTPTQSASSFPGPWQAISTDYSLPLADLHGLHQSGMDPGVFTTIMKNSPDFGNQLLSYSNASGGLLGSSNLAQVYGGAQAATPALMALPADAAALGSASVLPGLTGAAAGAAGAGASTAAAAAGAAEAGAVAAGGSSILAALGLAAL